MSDQTPTPRPVPVETPPEGVPIGRAVFLGTLVAGVGGIALAPAVQRALSGVGGALPSSLQGFAPTSGWRIYTVASPMPTFDPATYRLRVSGLVRRPASLRWSELEGLPGEQQVSTFHCVTGWTVEDVHWEGIRAATLLDRVKPLPSARFVTLFSMEGPYVDQVSLEQFTRPDVMLARRQDGRPLTRAHGSPLRLVIPEMYGYKNVKWVRELRFDAKPLDGYWEQQGYDRDAYVGRSNGYGSS